MNYDFELGHNTVETTRNTCCAKGEGLVDHCTVTRWLKKFCLGCKNLDNQVRSGRSKTVYFKAMLKAIEANSVSLTSYSPMRFVTFTTSVKASIAAGLYLKKWYVTCYFDWLTTFQFC